MYHMIACMPSTFGCSGRIGRIGIQGLDADLDHSFCQATHASNWCTVLPGFAEHSVLGHPCRLMLQACHMGEQQQHGHAGWHGKAAVKLPGLLYSRTHFKTASFHRRAVIVAKSACSQGKRKRKRKMFCKAFQQPLQARLHGKLSQETTDTHNNPASFSSQPLTIILERTHHTHSNTQAR